MTVRIRDASGTDRVEGDLLSTGGSTGDVLTRQADGTYAPAAAGAPHTCEALTGNNVNIADTASGELTWNTSLGPDSLLDLTTPGLPEFKVAGTYVVAVTVVGLSITAGGFFAVQLFFDWSHPTLTPALSAITPAFGNSEQVTLTGAWTFGAGAQLEVTVTNGDGAAARNFRITQAMIQRTA